MYEFNFQLKQSDFIKFQIAHIIFDKRYQVIYGIFAILLTLPSFSAIHGILGRTLYVLLIYLLFIVVSSLLVSLYVLTKRDFLVLAPTILKINEKIVINENKYAICSYHWHTQLKLVQHFGIVTLYLSPNMAILIPKRAFISPTQREQFVDFCQNAIQNNMII